MNQDFVHLHNHSTHSYSDAYGTPAQVLDAAAEQGFKALALTDHGALDGLISFYFDAKKRNIKPILGVEAFIVNSLHLRERGGTNPIKHVTLLAKSARGYKSLCRLMTVAHNEGFFFKPRIDWDLLQKEGEDLIVLSGCPQSAMFEDTSLLRRMKERFGPDFYLEAMPVQQPETYPALLERLAAEAAKYKIKTVLTGNTHYPKAADAKIQDVMMSINAKIPFNNPERFHMAPIYWLRSLQELQQHAKRFTPWLAQPKIFNAAAETTLEIAAKIDIKLDTSVPIKFDCGKLKAIQLLRLKVMEGRRKRALKWTSAYSSRLERELKLVEEKGFADYFLIVADLIAWAKHKGILVGPARGSSAGSLVCYLTGITEIDPMPFELLFERFIDSTRFDLPDIDTDFEDRYRDEVIAYLKNKYTHVGVLSAWSQWKAKSCLLDVARAFDVPHDEIRKITPLVIQRSGGDSRASFTLMDTFAEFDVARDVLKRYPQLEMAGKLEAQIRQKTRHAAGVIISAQPVDNFASQYDDGCLSIDGLGTKLIGAMKLDVLGINTLTVIAKALEAIKARHNRTVDVYKLNLEDPKVIGGFSARKLAGIFQYEGEAMKAVNRQVVAKNFNDLVIINAASRPGPLHCGGTGMFIRRRNGVEAVTYLHPIAEEITRSTLGVVMYQEQVIKLMQQLGKMSWEDTSTARKVMSGRRGSEIFNKLFGHFRTGAMQNGLDEAKTQEIWDQICTHGSWSFNLSHSVSYTMLAYWTMWLKVYYPAEFYWASIAFTSKEERQHELIKEWKHAGGQILQVNMSSAAGPKLEGEAIRMGWGNIKGVGEGLAKKLVDGAPYRSTSELVQRTRISKGTLTLLEDLGIVERLQLDFFKSAAQRPDEALLLKHCPWLFAMDLGKYRDPRCQTFDTLEPGQTLKEVTIVGVVREINLRDLNELNASRGEKGFKKELQPKFANLSLEDEHDSMLCTVSKKSYLRLQEVVWRNGGVGNIIKVRGVMMPEVRKVYANEIQILGRVGK